MSSSSTRQLAAIMFTDIVGYTTISGQDHSKAMEMVHASKEIQKPLVERHNGKWLKEMGDGIMVQFNSAMDAVGCAIDIQRASRADFVGELRIGIHLGDITIENDDVYGDGVNVASRLQTIADPGGIYISESVEKSIRGNAGIQSIDLGKQRLKNVDYPVNVYAIQGIGMPEPKILKEGTKLAHRANGENGGKKRNTRNVVIGIALVAILVTGSMYILTGRSPITEDPLPTVLDKSIVVLPFDDLSPDKDQGYFSDGMMEEILNHLVKIEDLKVVSRTTAMKYKDSEKTAKEIAADLGVATVLEGSVRKDGDAVRITVQLIDGKTDLHLFSEQYDRVLANIFDVQSDVAQRIAEKLHAQVTPEVQLRIEAIPTANSFAYELYLKGRKQIGEWWETWDINKVHEAISYYKETIRLDSDFSNAYVGLGQAYWMLAHWDPDYEPEFWDLSKNYLQEALELDPNNGWAYAELGVVQHNWDRDKDGARQSFEKAVELNPGDIVIRNHLRWFFYRIKDCDNLEKQSGIISSLQNKHYDPRKDLDLLMCQQDTLQILKLEEIDFAPHRLMMFRGEFQEVIQFMKDTSNWRDNLGFLGVLGEAYALSGKRGEALKLIDDLNELSKTRYVSKCTVAAIHLALGEEDKAFELLELALEERDYYLHILDWIHLSFYRIQDDPRYESVLERSWIPLAP